MSNEKREADDSRGLKEVLAVFSEVARKTSETEEPAVPPIETVLAVFSEIARKTSETEEPAVTNVYP